MRILKETLREAFTDLIGVSIVENHLEISPIAEAYVVKVATDMSSNAQGIASNSMYLTELLQKALDSDGLIRSEYLRVTGDVALFVTGIFPDSFESRKTCFNLEDYIDIGQTAYDNLGADVFAELAYKFPEIVSVLNTVSIKIDLTSRDLARYIKRRRTIDARIARR